MTEAGQSLLDILDLERLEMDLYRGIGSGGETPTRIFGGQVIAQALAAAYGTVTDRLCHSLHAYFIRPGDPEIPVIYQVDRARDGGSFTTRRVVAIQHGKQILNLSASFHVEEEGYAYQHDMPDVPTPEEIETREDHRAKHVHLLPEKIHNEYLRPRPIEIREIDPPHPLTPEVSSEINHMWFRMPDAVGQDQATQQILLAYASDMNLLGSSLRPHGLTWFQGKVMTASLDHAMWFHGPVNFADWNLYTMDAPFTGGARGFNRGKIYTRDGRLVASVAQEGLMRPIKPRT